MSHRFDVMSHELDVIKARLATTSHAQTHEEIQGLRARVDELGAAAARDHDARTRADARAAMLQLKLADLKGHRDRYGPTRRTRRPVARPAHLLTPSACSQGVQKS